MAAGLGPDTAGSVEAWLAWPRLVRSDGNAPLIPAITPLPHLPPVAPGPVAAGERGLDSVLFLVILGRPKTRLLPSPARGSPAVRRLLDV